MRKNASKPYRRLDRSERAAIERGLDKRKSCRQIARELRRSPSTVADEVARNRTVCRGPNKGGRAAEAPTTPARSCCRGRIAATVQVPQVPLLEKVEVRVLGRQGAGARRRRAARIQDGRRPGRGGIRARHGADQVRRRAGAVARADSAGQGGRDRGVGVDHIQVDRARLRGDEQPRAAAQVRLQAALARRAAKADVARRGTLVRRVHGVAGEERAAACEMDTVLGLKSDRRCLLTLYPRAFKFQIALPMPDKTAASTDRRSTCWRRRRRKRSEGCSPLL